MNARGMKRITTVAIVTLAMIGLHACKGNGQKEKVETDTFLKDVKDTAATAGISAASPSQPADKEHDVHPVTLTPTVSAKDVEFASAVTNSALNKVNTGKMALEKSTNNRVKNFATMLANDHTKLGDELNQIAKDKK